ncbi:xanthine dehydrogenase [Aliidongia dinghuensis]|uniref:Xanthine dehydrogenase n=1 Tax=Aliidongia dinghuensis TaxID=1867774 RepID=A0A8J2YTW0_9PROT|nr:xanthine dehydrogenase family protein subunit M [Aliidongia dinghuensis]GGF20842.1 xanthine dehydrogenase [Aliidongia dinghuensis]
MYVRPTTIDEAIGVLASQGGRILAGGTDFFPGQGDRPVVGPVLDISALDALKGIRIAADGIRIGAGTTWSTIAGAAELPPAFDALRAAAREVGGWQIQNAGTIAGNLCNASPAADGVPPLLALDASVELMGPAGRRVLPLDQFILGPRRTALAPDEIMVAILVPPPPAAARSRFIKLGARRYLVISIVMVAAELTLDAAGRVANARVAVGSCSAVARRLPALEQALVGAPAASGLAALVEPAHLAPLQPIDDVRATATYRRDAALTLVGRALDACLTESAAMEPARA